MSETQTGDTVNADDRPNQLLNQNTGTNDNHEELTESNPQNLGAPNANQNSENGTTNDLPLPEEGPPAYDAIYPGAMGYQNQYASYPQQYGIPQGGAAVQNQPQPQIVYTTNVVNPRHGGCPHCQGYLVQEYSMVGILLAIFCFPCGFLCCLLMTGRRCTNCHRKF